MKRRITIILLLLAGGAVVNVAVAWGIAYRTQVIADSGRSATAIEREYWAARSPHALPCPTTIFVSFAHQSRLGYIRIECLWDCGSGLHSPSLSVGETSAGLPMHSFSSLYSRLNLDPETGFSLAPHLRRTIMYNGTIVGEGGGRGGRLRYIPYRPIFPGFIINTFFYALLLWLLFAAPFAARRTLRRRRGQCEKCAYPIGVSPVCTECGAAVTGSRKANP